LKTLIVRRREFFDCCIFKPGRAHFYSAEEAISLEPDRRIGAACQLLRR
jgi:hypothetical protein